MVSVEGRSATSCMAMLPLLRLARSYGVSSRKGPAPLPWLARFRLRELIAPILAFHQERDRGKDQQSCADHHQACGNRPLEEDCPGAVGHDQRLTQAHLEGRRNDQTEH